MADACAAETLTSSYVDLSAPVQDAAASLYSAITAECEGGTYDDTGVPYVYSPYVDPTRCLAGSPTIKKKSSACVDVLHSPFVQVPDGYSTPVHGKACDDVGNFPDLLEEASPSKAPPSTVSDKGGSTRGTSPFSSEEEAVMQVEALLASLPSDKSRQRVVSQLKAAQGGGDFTVLEPAAVVAKGKGERENMDGVRQWNEEYQSVVSKGLKNLKPEDVRTIARLMNDFVRQAETYAKIIINELNVPDHRKTIKPAGVGGVAGGRKYIVQGILFKFCLDPLVSKKPMTWLYGGDRPDDDAAIKAAGLELQGLCTSTTATITSLHHPLIALIDYKGFRLVAICLLPIGPGSNDAGHTIKVGDAKLDQMMELLGEYLNLRKHLVGKQGATSKAIWAPTGAITSLLDGRGVFFRMLRPELVRSFRVPLSSDTFTGWGMYDDNRTEYELDVREATNLVIEERIPALAEEIDQLKMHSRGVNLRHLGRLRQQMRSDRDGRLIFSIALSRAFKSKLRERMRNSVQNQKHSASESDHFWQRGIKRTLKQKFPFLLTEEERHEDYDLRGVGYIKMAFTLSFNLGLVQLPSVVTEAIFKDPTSVQLVETDILSIPAIVKHTHLTHIFSSNICMLEAATNNHKVSAALRLLYQAREHLVTATNMLASLCPYANWVLGCVEVEIASRLLFDQEAERLFTSSYNRFERSCQLDKANQAQLNSWADALEQHAARLAANVGDVGRTEELRALAAVKRHLAARAGVTTYSLITMW
ncbi:uncharacterized protein ACA1_372570 [Acanthamoeba castellanii str. Neff]|uniref:Clu domain-containing protein n=1 Tax=Acanthamoeba castellanii (strain ATCC 30010 / Neff) TaxID=1257118 RepID=L8GHN8_ACACF|nr:uncharacterized protein ACA1_372570 [Acanthamoeba castellanii str. Neff]ELR12268.1 hypothetical protein ACA1_372570 [Acanthamoeba castellanii str. Neff]